MSLEVICYARRCTKIRNACKYINIALFTGWHCRLSPRGNIVNRGGAEFDNAFRGVTIYNVTLWRMLFFYYTEYAISTANFTAVRHCHVPFKIVIRPIDQSDCWKLTWGIITYYITLSHMENPLQVQWSSKVWPRRRWIISLQMLIFKCFICSFSGCQSIQARQKHNRGIILWFLWCFFHDSTTGKGKFQFNACKHTCILYSKSMKTQHFYFRFISNMDLTIKILFSLDNCTLHMPPKDHFFVLVDWQYALFKSTCSKTSYLTPCIVPHEWFVFMDRTLLADWVDYIFPTSKMSIRVLHFKMFQD